MVKELFKTLRWMAVALIFVVLIGILTLQSFFLFSILPSETTTFTDFNGETVGVLSIDGGIFSVEDRLKTLRKYRKNDSVKGLLIDVNSPGGAVAPSQELSDAVQRFASTGKPVVASVRSLGASGAYYVASSADTIVANPGSLVGSIGVIMQFMQVSDLMKKVGVDYRVVKSGEFKDLGSPFRDMKPKERAVLRTLIMDVYDQFLNHILENRQELSREQLEKIADGRVFTGKQALEKNLIDATGSRRDAIRKLQKAAGLEEEPTLWNAGERRFSLVESVLEILSPLKELTDRSTSNFQLLYMMPEWGKHGE
ncbi:MAG: signal peptide peptidase SppA [bacterium]